MRKLFEYPPDGWVAESRCGVSALISGWQSAAFRLGLESEILHGLNDKILRFEGVYLEFEERDYGCTLIIKITDNEKIDELFFWLWKSYVDKGAIWGGPYRKPLGAETPPLIKHAQQTASSKNGLHRKKYQRVIEVFKNFIIDAYEISEESAADFVTHTIDYIVWTYFPDNRDEKIFIFQQEMERHKEPYSSEECTVGYFVGADRLNEWLKAKRNPPEKKVQK